MIANEEVIDVLKEYCVIVLSQQHVDGVFYESSTFVKDATKSANLVDNNSVGETKTELMQIISHFAIM